MNKPDRIATDLLVEAAKAHFARSLKIALEVEHYARQVEVSPIPQVPMSPEVVALVDERLKMSQQELEGLVEIVDMLEEMEP